MNYQYDNSKYNPPAPVLPITIHIPGDSTKQMTIEALVDTGADITCLPKSFINALDAKLASSYIVFGINNVPIGSHDSYFLEFEIETTKKLVEVIAVDDESIWGRNFINEFILELNGHDKKLNITI